MSVPSVIDFKFAEDELPDSNIELEELAPEEEEALAEPALIKFEEKEEIIHDDIFAKVEIKPKVSDAKEKEIVKEILKDDNIIEAVAPKKEKKKRKPLSEEHKAKLAISRGKALEARRGKAAERKKMKELENEEKELLKTQKINKFNKLKKEVTGGAEEAEPKPAPKEAVFTKKDLEQAQLDAIMKYDSLRKVRKEEKKKAAMIEAERQKMLNTINRAVGGPQYQYRDGSNRFDGCY